MIRRLLVVILLGVGVSLLFPAVRDEAHWLRARLGFGGEGAAARYLEQRPDGRHAADALRLIDDQDWARTERQAQYLNVSETYEGYLAVHPAGAHAAEARDRIAEINWTAAVETGSSDALLAFLEQYPESPHAADGAALIEQRLWDEALIDGAPATLRSYIARYPDSARTAEATALIEAGLTDDAPFTRAARSGNAEALNTFLERYAGHAREADARAALVDAEGRDIFDLIEEGKLEVTVDGAGIDSVRLTVKNTAPHGLNVIVEPGTFFVSDSYAQDMVAVSRREFSLEADFEIDISIDAACASQHDAVPEEGDGFSMRRGPPNDDLAKLARLLDERRPFYEVKQAAVWIVTDDSDYDGLGDLVSSSGFGFESRMIYEIEAAEAMRLIADAGVDIRERAIWQDRQMIAKGLAVDDENRSWLLEN